MSWYYETKTGTKHKVFISYYHNDDQYYRNRFEELFGHIFINSSVKPGDIATDLSDEYIKRLIQLNCISGSSVIVVLIGAKTYCRKHVDWEISAGLNKKVGGYSGLVGLCLPSHPDYSRSNYDPNITPPRLADNLKSEYARYYNWTESEGSIKKWVEEAFNARVNRANRIDNSRMQFINNRCD